MVQFRREVNGGRKDRIVSGQQGLPLPPHLPNRDNSCSANATGGGEVPGSFWTFQMSNPLLSEFRRDEVRR